MNALYGIETINSDMFLGDLIYLQISGSIEVLEYSVYHSYPL